MVTSGAKIGLYRPILGLVVLALCGLTGCAGLDYVFGGPTDEGFGGGILEPILEPLAGSPGPLGLGAAALLGLGNLWQLFRGKNWKALATDGVKLIADLKAHPEGKKLWEKQFKPRWKKAKKNKKIAEFAAIIKEIRLVLKDLQK